jgi:mercuric ion binding protein
MKAFKLSLLFVLALMLSLPVMGQQAKKKSKIQVAEIKTSAQCGECDERITKALTFHKGIREIELDLDTKVLTVTYNSKKTDLESIRTAINEVGYDADEQPAIAAAYEALPACCKKNGHCEDKGTEGAEENPDQK